MNFTKRLPTVAALHGHAEGEVAYRAGRATSFEDRSYAIATYFVFWQEEVEAAAKAKVEELSKALDDNAAHCQELQEKLETSQATAKKIQVPPPSHFPPARGYSSALLYWFAAQNQARGAPWRIGLSPS